jgi:chloramphenicol 3-O-phosphotransferase
MDLVFLHGGAASGKLTTARALEELIGFPVFHNHLVVDLLLPIFPFGSEAFVRLREQFWLAVFSEAAIAQRSITFTFTPEHSVPEGFPLRARHVVEAAGGRICFVRLTVDELEQERRITDPSRREFYKLTDLATLRRNRAQPDSEQPPADLEIDTTNSPPAQTAKLITGHFGLTPAARSELYPSSQSS